MCPVRSVTYVSGRSQAFGARPITIPLLVECHPQQNRGQTRGPEQARYWPAFRYDKTL
jgi:hypothetical protein